MIYAVEVAFECIHMTGPEPAELLQPGIHLLKWFRFQPVETALCVHHEFHETGLSQTRRCFDTVGCGIPSRRSISPTDCWDETSRLNIVRRFGSAMISNTDSMLFVYSTEHIRVIAEEGLLVFMSSVTETSTSALGKQGETFFGTRDCRFAYSLAWVLLLSVG